MQRIQPDGPITLLGETWCAPIAIELASLLQSSKRIVELFLIEGSPETWKRHIRTLGEINTPQFESNFLKYMLNFDPKVIANYHLGLYQKLTIDKCLTTYHYYFR